MRPRVVDRSNNGSVRVQQSTTTVSETAVKEEEKPPVGRRLFYHCTHEARLAGLRREIHGIHQQFFNHTPNQDIRLIIGHRNNPNLEYELAQKRPRPICLIDDPSKTARKSCMHVDGTSHRHDSRLFLESRSRSTTARTTTG